MLYWRPRVRGLLFWKCLQEVSGTYTAAVTVASLMIFGRSSAEFLSSVWKHDVAWIISGGREGGLRWDTDSSSLKPSSSSSLELLFSLFFLSLVHVWNAGQLCCASPDIDCTRALSSLAPAWFIPAGEVKTKTSLNVCMCPLNCGTGRRRWLCAAVAVCVWMMKEQLVDTWCSCGINTHRGGTSSSPTVEGKSCSEHQFITGRYVSYP